MNQSQLYEGMYIISATLSEDARKKAIERITALIEELGGKTEHVLDWGRKKLAYQIGRHKEGYFYLIYFGLERSKMPELWDEHKLNEDLVRYMTTTATEVRREIKFKTFSHEE